MFSMELDDDLSSEQDIKNIYMLVVQILFEE
jgi:hypothetical protein